MKIRFTAIFSHVVQHIIYISKSFTKINKSKSRFRCQSMYVHQNRRNHRSAWTVAQKILYLSSQQNNRTPKYLSSCCPRSLDPPSHLTQVRLDHRMTAPNHLPVQPYPSVHLTLIPAPSPCTLPVLYRRANNPEWPLPSREREAAGPGDHKERIGLRWHQATPVVRSVFCAATRRLLAV